MNGESVPYIGIFGTTVTDDISQQQGMPDGVYVVQVDADSPAMTAGIQSGDVIQSVGGTEVVTTSAYEQAVRKCRAGEPVKIRGSRLGADGYVDIEFDVTIGSRE